LAVRPSPIRGLLRRVYTSNPFYVLSADLVFIGLRMSFKTGGPTFETGTLMVALLGYTLLLATTACLLIRIGNVWDDVRTLLLLVVAMFLAISVTFDETLAHDPVGGTFYYLGGLAFAIAVSEAVLRGIRLRLPAFFRLPYYLILALFFLYPVALAPYLHDPDAPALQWMLFGFSPVAGLAFLCLIPAIRRGPGYVSKNGSPWRYPLYPWVLFGLLGSAVCGRAFYLCISFHFVGTSQSIFGLYFLVPFFLAVGVLVLEAGIVSRNRAVQQLALVTLPGTLLLASVGHFANPLYDRFLSLFQEGLGGSPLYVTLLALVVIYASAALRRVPMALSWLTLTFLILSTVEPTTLCPTELVPIRPLPLLSVAVLQSALAIRWRSSWRAVLAAVCLIAAIAISWNAPGFQVYENLVVFHLAIAVIMLIGAFFDDSLGALLKGLGAGLLTLASLTAILGGPESFESIPPEILRSYPLIVILVAAGYGVLTGCRAYYVSASVATAGWLGVFGWHVYAGLRHSLIGLDWIVGGMAFFALAALISLRKAGISWRAVFCRNRKPAKGSWGYADEF
jgi:hypothetical protein